MRAAKIFLLAVLLGACLAASRGPKRLHKAPHSDLEPVYIYQECNVPEHENVTMARVDHLAEVDFGGIYQEKNFGFTLIDRPKHIKACHDLWQWKESLEPCLRDEDPSDDPFVRASLDIIGDYTFKYECLADQTVARFIVSDQAAPPEYHVEQKH